MRISAPAGGGKSTFTVLVVDDDKDYLQVACTLLGREGYRVLCASSGSKALEAIRRETVDVMLLDYYMPGMTGEEVVSRLREFDPDVRIILQTGYASEQPPRDLMRRLDIQGYHDKSEGPENLLLWTTVGVKAAQTIRLLKKARESIRFLTGGGDPRAT